MFWPTHLCDPLKVAHFINTPYHLDDLIPHELYPTLIHHGVTGEVPVVVHLNGGDRVLMTDWWGKLWWNKLEGKDMQFKDIVLSRVRGATVQFAGGKGGSKEWKDLCPKEAKDWNLGL
jgi:hypothetical protein